MSIRIRLPRTRRFRRLAVTALVAAGLTLTGAAPAMAYTPVNIVHTERVQAVVYAHRHGCSLPAWRASRVRRARAEGRQCG
jgi:hypothetical protein